MKNYPVILLIFLGLVSAGFVFGQNSPSGIITATPTEVRANQSFNIIVSGEDDIDMGAVCYKEEMDSDWTCSSCLGTSTSCNNSFVRSQGALGKYTYYGLIADAAGNSSLTDPINISVLVETDPLVRTDSATDVQINQVTLKGEVLNMGGAEKAEVWFDYGPTTSYGSESNHIFVSTTGIFSIPVSGLSPGTAYHFRAAVKNGVGTVKGSDGQFVTFIELIKNGSFETGNLNFWTPAGQGDHAASTEDVHGGSYSGLIGFKIASLVKNGKSGLYQDVSIPAGATNINLSFWYKFYTTDQCPYDYLNIYLKDTSDNILKTYLEWCCEGCGTGELHTYGWNQITDNNLSAYAGQTVRIYFEVKNGWDTFHRSWAYLDDVSLKYIPSYLPSAETKPATGIKTTEVVLNGEILDMGRADSVEVWFDYGTTISYGNETSHSFKNSPGPFSAYVTGLNSDTTYYFRAVAKNGSGISRGSGLTFKTQYAAAGGWILANSFEDPEAKWSYESKGSDGDAITYAEDWSNRLGWGAYLVLKLNTSIKSNKVRVNADFTPTRWARTDMVEVGVFYEGDSDFTTIFQGQINDCDWSEITFPEGKITKARFRWHYGSSGYIYWLYEFQFYQIPAVPITLPAGNTLSPTSIEENSAALHGQVTDDGGETIQYRFEYGKTTSYGLSTPWEGSLASGQTFGRMVIGLEEGVTYHFRAQVKNSTGIASGADEIFFTQSASGGWVSPTGSNDPDGKWTNEHYSFDDELESYTRSYHGIGDSVWSSYIYLTHKEISSDKIRFNARGAPQVDAVNVDLYKDGSWVTVYNGSFNDRQWVQATTTSGKVTQARIQFHATASNEGFYWQLYEFDFWKLPEKPLVETQAASGIGSTQATLNGKLTDMGGVASADVWFGYGITTSYGSSTSLITKNTIGTFSQAVTNLNSSTTYHFRAVARNAAGTSYGNDMSFNTLGSCVSGNKTNCTSTEGCPHEIVCEDGGWPPCPRDECTKNSSSSSDCPCPAWKCEDLDAQGRNNDWIYYGPYFGEGDPRNFCGNCDNSCACNMATTTGQPCQETVVYNNSSYCNQAPYATNTSVYLGDWCYCTTDITPRFSWDYFDLEGDIPDSYQVQVSTSSNFSSVLIDSCLSPEPRTCEPGIQSKQYAPITPVDYNTRYYWRVKVKDINGKWSQDWATGTSFMTSSHRWPRPDFIYSPNNPVVGESIEFIDQSLCYDLNNEKYPCKEINPITGTYNIYLWDFADGATSLAQATTTHSYSQPGSYEVKLWVTDPSLAPDSGMCDAEHKVMVFLPLPDWKEIAPW